MMRTHPSRADSQTRPALRGFVPYKPRSLGGETGPRSVVREGWATRNDNSRQVWVAISCTAAQGARRNVNKEIGNGE